jgi:hypothetical protein
VAMDGHTYEREAIETWLLAQAQHVVLDERGDYAYDTAKLYPPQHDRSVG